MAVWICRELPCWPDSQRCFCKEEGVKNGKRGGGGGGGCVNLRKCSWSFLGSWYWRPPKGHYRNSPSPLCSFHLSWSCLLMHAHSLACSLPLKKTARGIESRWSRQRQKETYWSLNWTHVWLFIGSLHCRNTQKAPCYGFLWAGPLKIYCCSIWWNTEYMWQLNAGI